jgi:hypothetical protein
MKKLPLYAAALASAALGLFAVAPANATPIDPLTGVTTGTDLSFKLLGVTTSSNPYGSENTWGLGTITQITDASTGTSIWSNGGINGYLNYMIYGITDISTTGTIPNINVDSNNVHIDIYLSSTPMNLSGGPNARTGLSTYPGINSGDLWLSLVLAPGCDPSNSAATLCQTLQTSTDPANGSGTFAAATITGGLAQYELADLSGIFDIQTALPGNKTAFTPSGACNSAGADLNNCFDEVISDPVSATKIPEPSSLSIMGGALALMGAATWLRRHRKAQGSA